MPTMTIFDNECIGMWYHTETKIVHHHFYPKLNSHYLRAGLNRGIELLKENGGTKWLSDNRELEPHSPEDSDWVNNDWLPRVIEAGWKHWALVVPNTVAARMNMSEFVETFYNQGVWVVVFTDVDEAMSWLKKR